MPALSPSAAGYSRFHGPAEVKWLEGHDWSKAEQGPQTRLTASARRFAAGEPIPMRLEMQNVGGKAVGHYGVYPYGRGLIGVTGPDGKALELLKGPFSTTGGNRFCHAYIHVPQEAGKVWASAVGDIGRLLVVSPPVMTMSATALATGPALTDCLGAAPSRLVATLPASQPVADAAEIFRTPCACTRPSGWPCGPARWCSRA
ncbi:MAG: hypothetical protein ACE15C_06725 [Phycisphaerae bacterium]